MTAELGIIFFETEKTRMKETKQRSQTNQKIVIPDIRYCFFRYVHTAPAPISRHQIGVNLRIRPLRLEADDTRIPDDSHTPRLPGFLGSRPQSTLDRNSDGLLHTRLLVVLVIAVIARVAVVVGIAHYAGVLHIVFTGVGAPATAAVRAVV